MKNLTNLELLMEYMKQNQYFIGNDLLGKYNELLKKEKKEQLILSGVVVPKGALSDFEKWLDKKENKSYCGLPSQYVLDKYKSLNAL
jgi:hypothetical protein|tara:strand:+ start:86 stop:346 length:261 start_codon:yes stop_codon:yes gene_type:complete